MNRLTEFALTTMVLLSCSVAMAQRTTEVYIPIGESPGVSGEQSIVGTIADVDYDRYSMIVSTGTERRTIEMTPDTRYYIDRSGEHEKSVAGNIHDCHEGQRIEAYVDADGDAVWIKIAAY